MVATALNVKPLSARTVENSGNRFMRVFGWLVVRIQTGLRERYSELLYVTCGQGFKDFDSMQLNV
jgi:hypothetical protein